MKATVAGVALLAAMACEQPAASVDLAAERSSLLEADRRFARATAEERLEGWVGFFAEDGVMFPAGRPVIRDEESIRALMGPLFDDEGFSLAWEPLEAEVSAGGDLGYTYGSYESRSPGPDGVPSVTTGKYLTVWRKQGDGSWKVVADIGNTNPPATDRSENP